MEESKKMELKRPKSLPAWFTTFRKGSREWLVVIGLKDNRPYEIFVDEYNKEEGIYIPKSATNLKVIKTKDEQGENIYVLHFNKKKTAMTCEGLGLSGGVNWRNSSRLVAALLRYEIPIEKVIEEVKSLWENEELEGWKHCIIKALNSFNREGSN